MARCTAPVYGHRTASGAAACPACGGRYSSYGSYAPVLLLVGEKRRRVRQQRKAALVASRFVCLIHTGPSAVTDASPQCR